MFLQYLHDGTDQQHVQEQPHTNLQLMMSWEQVVCCMLACKAPHRCHFRHCSIYALAILDQRPG